MSTRRKHNPKTVDAEKTAIVAAYGKGAMAVLNSIRAGTVDEEELDKLHNLIVTALVMMERMPLTEFRAAQRIAELRTLMDAGYSAAANARNTGEHDTTDNG